MSLTPDSPVATQVVPPPTTTSGPCRSMRDPALYRMASGSEALLRLCNPLSKVSSHYIVLEAGRVVQMVPRPARLACRPLAWEGCARS